MELKAIINQLVEQKFEELLSIRRHLHQNPELSFQEFGTSKFICSTLEKAGVPYESGFVKTGILARVEGNNPASRCIALRADMDALPIQEKNDVPYASKNNGVMHACGHDVHSTSLLGVAMILNQLRDKFEGTVLLIFQPAEEKLPGGAKLMLDEGALKKYNPELIVAQHVLPTMDVGKVGFRSGMYMASCDELYVTVKGTGGHAAMPHQLTDPVATSAQLIMALQQIVSRHAPATIPSVLSFGKIIADGATNVIPAEVRLEGTFRTLDEEWRTEAHQKMTRMAQSIAEANGCTCEFRIDKGYPFLINDPGVSDKASTFAMEYMPEGKVEELDIRMTSEDFAYFSQEYPVTMYRLGVRNVSKGINSPLHTSTFNIDEEALKTGAGLLSWLAVKFLEAK